MKKQLLLVVVLITTLLSSCSENKNKEVVKQITLASNEYTLNTSKLDSLFKELEKKGEFMGSIALSHNGTIIYNKRKR